MRQEKIDILTLLIMLFFFLLVTVEAVIGWTTGAVAQGVITTLLAVVIGAALVMELRQGVRSLLPFERFRAWMSLRPIIIVFGGLGLMALAVQVVFPATIDWPQPMKVVLVIVPLLIWGVSVVYTLVRAPRRREPDSAYKRRIGYKDR